jgi:hypothetical protein
VNAVLVIAYLIGGQVIDTETLDAANMAECQATKQNVMTGTTPVTTRYSSNVQIKAECKKLEHSAELRSSSSIF